MKKVLIIAALFLSVLSCKKETFHDPVACDCTSVYTTDYPQDIEGYYHIPTTIPRFQIKGQLEELHPDYLINGVPDVSASLDSDYWILFENVFWSAPVYSYWGYFTDNNFQNVIPFDTVNYTLQDYADMTGSVYNLAGYEITKNTCWDCLYIETILYTYSRYNYHPTFNILVLEEMEGDTATFYIKNDFAENFPNQHQITYNTIKVIFE